MFLKRLKDFIFIVFGCAVSGLGLNIFIFPNNIAPGGATGAAMILNTFAELSVGLWIIILNLPLFIISLKAIGKSFFIKTFIATTLLSLFIDLFYFIPSFTQDIFLSSIIGGAINGAGLAIVFSRGVMTGGSDLLARLIKIKIPTASLGKLIMVIDGIVILSAMIVFRNIAQGLYAVVSVFVSARIIDAVLLGSERAKTALIITDKAQEIYKNVISDLEHSATIMNAKGGYTQKDKSVVLCAVKRYEIYKLKDVIMKTDKNAFVVVFDAAEIVGKGFSAHS